VPPSRGFPHQTSRQVTLRDFTQQAASKHAVHSRDYLWHHWTDLNTGSDVTKSGPVRHHQTSQETGPKKTEQQRIETITWAEQTGPQKEKQRPWAELFPPPKRVVKKEVN
jgi:hypothetical protein